MFCPVCGAEYRPDVTECADCGVSLVLSPPEQETGEPDAKIVAVFRTTDAALLPVVRSLLDSAGIEYFVQGEEALGLLPVGGMGSNVGRASLGAIIHVAEEDAESVKEMLAEISEADDLDEAVAADYEEVDDSELSGEDYVGLPYGDGDRDDAGPDDDPGDER